MFHGQKVKGQLVADVLHSQHTGIGATWRINTKILLCRNSTDTWRINAKILSTCRGRRHIVSLRAQLVMTINENMLLQSWLSFMSKENKTKWNKMKWKKGDDDWWWWRSWSWYWRYGNKTLTVWVHVTRQGLTPCAETACTATTVYRFHVTHDTVKDTRNPGNTRCSL